MTLPLCLHSFHSASALLIMKAEWLTGISDRLLDTLEPRYDRQGDVAAAVPTVESICIGRVLLSNR